MTFRTRAIALLLLLLMLIPSFAFSASAKEITINASGVDAVRESGALVIYTPAKGETTGTNEWGYEVVIEDNVAVKFNKGNSKIPANGFVLSGHDEGEGGKNMGTWISENIKLGDYVYYTADGLVTVSDKPIAEQLFYTLTQKILGVNVTRQVDTIVIYNRRGMHTETNEWGYEIVCENGVVVAVGGNNNLVPLKENSFVVSGHGAMVTWLQNNVKLGMTASYDENKKTVSFSFDENSAISNMDICIKNLTAEYEAAYNRYDYFDHASAKAAIDALAKEAEDAKTAFKKNKDSAALVTASKTIENKVHEIRLLISESKTVEYRGVWIRPTDTSAKQVEETVQALYENGINTICIETLYDCTMIMPMPEDSLFETNPKFKKFDMLQCYIDECHERGMELHLWMPIFYVGDATSKNKRYSLGAKKPEWLSLANNGKYSHELGGELGALMMLDPANEEACNYLLSTYKYILEKYDVDGFQLDYIRYFVRTADYDMGYNDTALDAFEEKYGVRPEYKTNAPYWKNWVDFRCQYVDNFVKRVRKLIDDVAPDVLLGADVVPDPTDSVDNNYQNYYTWLENKWIDVLFPMSYGYGYEEDIKDQTIRCGENAFIAVGLGIFMPEMTISDMQIQASYNNSVYADGSVYFEASAYNKKQTGEYLANGVYRNSAITPTFDVLKGAKAYAEYAKGRVNDIIVPLAGMTEEDGKKIVSAIDELAATFTENSFDADKYNAALAAVDATAGTSTAKSRIKADIKQMVKAYTVMNKELDLSGVPEIPQNPDYSETVSEPVSSEESIAPGEESEPTEENGFNLELIIAIIAGVVIIAALAVIVVFTKKKGNK